MSPVLDCLYDCWVGLPKPERWPEELRDNPVDGHSRYAFREGLRLGLLLYAECTAPDFLWPQS